MLVACVAVAVAAAVAAAAPAAAAAAAAAPTPWAELLPAARSAHPSLPPGPPALPSLPCKPRHDWLNVKAFGAVGDGVADDTAAVQAALGAVTAEGENAAPANKTVFFPAGTFRITTTLLLNRTAGAALVGCGAGTTLRWGGPAGGVPPETVSRMLWSDGNTRSEVVGIVFDGAGVAGVGLDHDSHTVYESRFVHRHLAFANFTVAGVRVGHNQYAAGGVASAEMTFDNLVFHNNAAGVQFLAWNDYDNAISGCEFWGNGVGVNAVAGNFYASATRFVGSTIADATITAHASSLRRIVSVGSRQFITTAPGNGGGSPTKVHGCYVVGWGAGAANESVAAVYMGPRGPLQVVDTVFAAPANATSPAIALGGGSGGASESVLLSNVTMADGALGPVLDPASASNVSHLYTIPPGNPAIAARLPPLSPATSFFATSVPFPTASFDAVTDFGADNTGRTPSAAALQACIDAAAAAGAGSECYLPTGTYTVNVSLRLCGDGITLVGGGSGFTTLLAWDAAPGPAVVLAAGPAAGCAASNVTLRRLNAFTPAKIAAGQADLIVSRTATVPASPTGRHPEFNLPGGGDPTAPVSLTLDSFYFSSAGGAILNALAAGDVVRGPLWDGNLEVLDSAAATVLGGFYAVEGDGLTVARLAPPTPAAAAVGRSEAGGFLGFNVMVSASTAWDLRVFNSCSVAVSDWYTETSHGNVWLAGGPGDAPGLVAVSAAKLNTNSPAWAALYSSGFTGTLWHSGAVASYAPFNVTVEGGSSLDVAVIGESFWVNATVVNTTAAPATTVHMLGSIYVNGPPAFAPDVVNARTPDVVAAGLDALRMVGILDVELNFPWVLE
jgi:hypothetical protein